MISEMTLLGRHQQATEGTNLGALVFTHILLTLQLTCLLDNPQRLRDAQLGRTYLDSPMQTDTIPSLGSTSSAPISEVDLENQFTFDYPEDIPWIPGDMLGLSETHDHLPNLDETLISAGNLRLGHGSHRDIDKEQKNIRRSWVCKDISADRSFLANCKDCRSQKRYPTKYNAAVHLRNSHFITPKSSRYIRGKSDQKREINGTYDFPTMEELENWMTEITEPVPGESPQDTSTQDPEPSHRVPFTYRQPIPDPETQDYNKATSLFPPNLVDQDYSSCNTLCVGNLPLDSSANEIIDLFSKQRGYKRLCLRTKQTGPMCFVEFEDESTTKKAQKSLDGKLIRNCRIRVHFSRNPLGVRNVGAAATTNPTSGSVNASGTASTFTPPPSLTPASPRSRFARKFSASFTTPSFGKAA